MGIDCVLLRGDAEVAPVYAYRNIRTETVILRVHEIMSFSELYRRTGCQFQPFNSMWLVNELCRNICPDTPFSEIVATAQTSDCALLVDANAPEFLSPVSMKAAFDTVTNNQLRTPDDYFHCAYRSFAASYWDALDGLEGNTGKTYEKLYIVGGGAKNAFLNT